MASCGSTCSRAATMHTCTSNLSIYFSGERSPAQVVVPEATALTTSVWDASIAQKFWQAAFPDKCSLYPLCLLYAKAIMSLAQSQWLQCANWSTALCRKASSICHNLSAQVIASRPPCPFEHSLQIDFCGMCCCLRIRHAAGQRLLCAWPDASTLAKGSAFKGSSC